jgi:hypothetical protein
MPLMPRPRAAAGAALAIALPLSLALPAAAQTAATLNCSVSGVYADGSRIAGTGTEEILVDIRAPSLAAPGSNEIRVTANGRSYKGTLLRANASQVAFSYVSDAVIDGSAQTLSMTYELRLEPPRLKRTVMALFSSQFGAPQSAEGNCVRPGAAAAAAPAAAAAASAAPPPAWLAELRRKLKECDAKDPFSASACVERMQSRYCSNRPAPLPAECTTK